MMGNKVSSPIVSCLSSAVGGHSSQLALPSEPLFKLLDARPYNLDVDVHPVAVTYPKTSDEVAAIIKCAGTDYKVQARSGGHSYANYALGGGDTNTIVIDLKNFQQFSIDPTTFNARIGTGHKLGAVTSKLLSSSSSPSPRAIAHGTCPDVGIGGHATMGGLGPLSRQWGSAMDHVLSAQVVLANSSIVTASPTSYPDIFWAIKGAGASFGIITEFEMRTHPAPGEMVQYSYAFSKRPYASLASRFRAWQDLISDPGLSWKFASQVLISEVGMVISGTYFGSAAEFAALNISAAFPDVRESKVIAVNDFAGEVAHWAEDIALTIGGVIPSAFYSKNVAFTARDLLPDTTVDKFFQYLDEVDKGTIIWFAIFDLEGGAINDVPVEETSYGHRDALFYLQTYAVNVGSKLSEKTRGFVEGMDGIVRGAFPERVLGSYAGYVDPQLADAQERYFGGNLERLRRVKSLVDPGDVFHNPQSVRPI